MPPPGRDGGFCPPLAEATNFVKVIYLGKGDLIPALDLEVSGGLGVTALRTWVKTFLDAVTTKIGSRPMICTSPSFWKTYMGDSHALADAGHKTLWIAHWGVTSPTVPANNWGGHGRTFWRYTDCGHVSGISGCVDLDRYNGTDLQAQAFSIFKLAATSVVIKHGQSGVATVSLARTNYPAPSPWP